MKNLTEDQIRQLYDDVLKFEEYLSTNKLREIYFKRYRDRDPDDPPELWGAYDWQVDFHNSPARERCLLAGNRTGKTRSVAAEVAMHAIGEYPDWWEGRRFTKPVQIMVGGVNNKNVRDVPQRALLGEIEGTGEKRCPDGTGWIPKENMGQCSFAQVGIKNVVDSIRIKHISGKDSTIVFMSYQQEASAFQGVARDVVWLDEEPEGEHAMDYFTEMLVRTADTNGILMMSRTPLFGETPIIAHFIEGKHNPKASIDYFSGSWDECPHITPEAKAALLESFPEYERECRSMGIPMLGSGRIYKFNDSEITYKQEGEIPYYWPRIAGLDIGVDHPTTICWIALDPNTNRVVVYDEYKQKGEGILYHAQAFKERGDWIPVAWPHDVGSRDKGQAKPIVDQYREAGANMLGISARLEDKVGGGQPTDAIIMVVTDMFKTGRLKISDKCQQLLREIRLYHRKDGKIVRVDEDLISALHYAIMMLRYARPNTNPGNGSGVFGSPHRTVTTHYESSDPFLC